MTTPEGPVAHGRAVPSVPVGRWDALALHRARLVALARRHGAGDDAEDVAQEALLRAAVFGDLDMTRVAMFLSAVTLRIVADLHRRAVRDRALSRDARLVPSPGALLEDEVCNREEARWAAAVVAHRMPADLVELLRRRAAGTSWAELAVEWGEGVRALETRTRRAALDIRRRIAQPGLP